MSGTYLGGAEKASRTGAEIRRRSGLSPGDKLREALGIQDGGAGGVAERPADVTFLSREKYKGIFLGVKGDSVQVSPDWVTDLGKRKVLTLHGVEIPLVNRDGGWWANVADVAPVAGG